jgi:branched-chain amino acid transport system substrate-binding protein
LGAALLVAALGAAACGGGGGGDGTSTAATVDPGVKAGVAQALGGSGSGSGNGSATSGPGGDAAAGTTSTTSAAEPASLEDWEALWAKERAAQVDKIKANGWGRSADGRTLTGPDGFTIDLSACPAGWSDSEGLSDDSIKIGETIALSGTAADYGNIARSMDVIFRYYSDKGAFKDVNGKTRKIDLMFRDDGYDAARTIPLVDELIDSEKVFAMWTLGSPPGLKSYDKLNQRCIPHPFEMSGHPAWGDPVNHPWTTGLQMAYSTEAVLWGAFIEQHASELPADKIKVASISVANDFGTAYNAAFKAYIEQSSLKGKVDYFNEAVEAQAPTVTDPMTTIAAKHPDVFINMAGGSFCPQIVIAAAQNGLKTDAKYLFMSSVCKAASFVGKDKVGGDGSASDGWWIVGGGVKDFNSPAEDDDPYIAWGRQLLSAGGIDYKQSGSFGSGFLFAFPMVQGLQVAGQLPGGLSRSNFILALRSMDMTHPMLLPGIKFNLSGNKDAYFIEGSDIGRYDSAKQQWVQQGETIALSGKSTPCAYDPATSQCH